ncbi:MAG: sensor histidine kinase [Rhodospirillales bacterium]
MFRIYRYFAIASAVVIAIAMGLVVLLYRHYAVDDLVDVAERYNVSLARLLSNTVWQDYFPASETSESTPLTADEIARLDEVVRRLTANLPVLKVKIYSPDGLTVYSTEHAQIGERRRDNVGLSTALRLGKPQSKLSRRDRFSAFSREVFNLDLIETYVPVANEAGVTAGIFEVYSDVTEIRDRIDHAIFSMVVGLSVTFVLLYGTLAFVVMRRAIAPLRRASAHAAAIGPRSSGARLPLDGMPAEVMPLIDAMNGALDRLDKALEAHRRFTADAAHELLTPLAVLTANLDTIKDQERVAELRADVDTMSDVVTQLLELAELDAFEPTDVEPTNLRDVCLEVVSTMAPLAYRQGKAIELTGSAQPVMVRCSEKMIARALRNLVENAIVHTSDDTSVEVGLREDGVICVSDHGPGVPPAERELIFQRFWRGTTRDRRGAGLGLSIVKRAVETCGGAVEVSDAPDGGAMFTLSLPLVETPAD